MYRLLYSLQCAPHRSLLRFSSCSPFTETTSCSHFYMNSIETRASPFLRATAHGLQATATDAAPYPQRRGVSLPLIMVCLCASICSCANSVVHVEQRVAYEHSWITLTDVSLSVCGVVASFYSWGSYVLGLFWLLLHPAVTITTGSKCSVVLQKLLKYCVLC